MSKKILAALLAVLMVLTLVPMTALAADGENEATIGATEYETLQAAINAVPTDGTLTTIKLLKDIELNGTTDENTPTSAANGYTSALRVEGGRNVVLDLAGKKLTNKSTTIAYTISVGAASTGNGKEENKPATASNLTVIDTVGGGIMDNENPVSSTIDVDYWGTLTIGSETEAYNNFKVINNKKQNTMNSTIKVEEGPTKLIVLGGTIDAPLDSAGTTYGRSVQCLGTAEIKGGTILHEFQVWSYVGYPVGNLSISGGILEEDVSVRSTNNTPANWPLSSTITITGGQVKGDAKIIAATEDQKANSLASIKVSGGSVRGVSKDAGKIEISGGVFSTDVSEYCGENLTTIEGADGKFTIGEAAISIVPAPLHDTSNQVTDAEICSNYSVSASGDKISVYASNVRLHKNANTTPAYGYWTGVQFKAPNGYTVKYKGLDGSTADWAIDPGSEGKYVSLHNDFELKPTRTITIGMFRNDTLVTGSEKTYTIDFTNVNKKAPNVTLHYTALADKNVVPDCADETIWAQFDEPVRPGYLWFDIKDPNGNLYGIAAVANESETTHKLPTKQAWSFQNKGQFEVWPMVDGRPVELGVTTGTYTVTGYYVDAQAVPTEKPANDKLKAFFTETVEVVAPVEDVEIAAPADPAVAVEGVEYQHQSAVGAALEKAAATTDSEGTLANAANAAASQTSTKAEYSETAANAALEAAGLTPGTEEEPLTIVYQPFLEVKATAYDNTNKSLTVDITPKCYVLATTENVDNDKYVFGQAAGNNAVKLGVENLTINTPIELQIGLPAGFTETGDPGAYVIHKNIYVYNAKVENSNGSLLATFTNPHGFSEFVFRATNPVVAKIGEQGYSTLQAAINAVEAGGVVVVVGDASKEKIIVDKNVKLVKDANAEAKLPLTSNIAAASGYNWDFNDSLTGVLQIWAWPSGSSVPPLNPPIDGTGNTGNPNAPTVTLTPDTTGNYTLAFDKTAAKAGEQVTVTVTPDEGTPAYYVVSAVTAKGDTTATATKNANGTFTFTMPAGNKVVVSATISHIFDLFTDVPAGSFYVDPVKWAVEQGITLGNSTDYSTFGTTASCTRAQMVVFLYRAAGSPDVTGTTNSFTDLPADEEIRKAVQWAVDNGITQGTSTTTFAPNDVCTRSQMVTFLYRYDEEPAITGSNSFADVPADAFYKTAVQWAVNKEVTQGTNAAGTTFEPYTACSRGQMVTFLYRYMGE